jgi:hypothetical protein
MHVRQGKHVLACFAILREGLFVWRPHGPEDIGAFPSRLNHHLSSVQTSTIPSLFFVPQPRVLDPLQ